MEVDGAVRVAHGTHGTETKYMQICVWLGFLSESANVEEPGVDGRINLILRKT
jgi:hypothetical protein